MNEMLLMLAKETIKLKGIDVFIKEMEHYKVKAKNFFSLTFLAREVCLALGSATTPDGCVVVRGKVNPNGSGYYWVRKKDGKLYKVEDMDTLIVVPEIFLYDQWYVALAMPVIQDGEEVRVC